MSPFHLTSINSRGMITDGLRMAYVLLSEITMQVLFPAIVLRPARRIAFRTDGRNFPEMTGKTPVAKWMVENALL
jgi:hypothetical protein